MFVRSVLSNMDKRKIPSDKDTTNAINTRLVITVEQKFDVTERHDRGHSISETGRDAGMSECTVWNIIKHSGEIKEKSKIASAFCGLPTSKRNRSVNSDRNRVSFNCMG
jgi:hypothetical protein